MASGRLALTWAHKGESLISDGAGGYEWVSPDDVRVREVRLLDEISRVGEVTGTSADNLLIRGDGLHAMQALLRTPEYADEYRGKVKLVYIDPPFNTGQAFEHYDDGVEHSVWLGLMRERFEAIAELLDPDGSVWVHLDDAEAHYAKALLDEVFGRSSFVTTVVWRKRTTRDNRAAFSDNHDFILVYAPRGKAGWKHVRNLLPDGGKFQNPDDDPRGPWRSVPLSAQAGRATKDQFWTVTTPTGKRHDPPRGRAWTYTERRFQELLEKDLIHWPRNGDGKPRLKRFPTVDDGLVPMTLWADEAVGTNDVAKKEILTLFPEVEEVFDTPKPEGLLKRILEIASDPGDVVMDVFAGSGTTAAVAHKTGRRWVTAEIIETNVDTFVLPRLIAVQEGNDLGGISSTVETVSDYELPEGLTASDARQFRTLAQKMTAFAIERVESGEDDPETTPEPQQIREVIRHLRKIAATRSVRHNHWTGGGGFRELRVADPVFETHSLGYLELLTIAEADDKRFKRSVTAQLGFEIDDTAPFTGRRGRQRLAVVRGVLDMVLAETLIGALEAGETLVVAATSIDDAARTHVRNSTKGSKVIALPAGLFPKGGAR